MPRGKLRPRGLVCPNKQQCTRPGLYSFPSQTHPESRLGEGCAQLPLQSSLLTVPGLSWEQGSLEQTRWELLSPLSHFYPLAG